ncbi:MAG: hypothetical protein ACRC2O_17350, partial [Chitinophagaceae bacterium]
MKKFGAKCSILLSIIFIFSIQHYLQAQGTRLLRQPSASKDHIAFVHGDDIWITSIAGGDARRLTSAMGTELNPRISPDGKMVAFTGQYDGNTDIYIVPIEGGMPARLTWHPGAELVQGWFPDSKKIIFTSAMEGYPTANTKFFTVSPKGGNTEAMNLPFGFTGSLSDDGQFMAYQPYSFWDPEWRNYRG